MQQIPAVSLVHTERSIALVNAQHLAFQQLGTRAVEYDEDTWPGVQTLLSDITKTIANIQGIIPTGHALDQALADVPKLECVPQMLLTNLGDLFTIMKTLHDLSSFLQNFPVLNVLLKPVTDSLADEELAIQHLQTDTGQVISYSDAITSSIKVSKIL